MRKNIFIFYFIFHLPLFINAQTVYQLKGLYNDDFATLNKDKKGNLILGGEMEDSDTYRNITIKSLNRKDINTASGTSADVVIIKQDVNDSILWWKTLGGYGVTGLSQIATDGNNNIVVIGKYGNGYTSGGDTFKSNYHTNGFMTKLDPTGKILWSKVIMCLKNDAYFQALRIDISTGDIYVKGRFLDSFTIDQKKYFAPYAYSFLARLDSNGNISWLHVYRPASNSSVGYYLDDIQFDNSGNLLISAQAGKAAAFLDNSQIVSQDTANRLLLISINKQGALNWVNSANQNSFAGGNSIKVDKDDNIYVTGFYSRYISFGTTKLFTAGQDKINIDQDIFLAKFDKDGNPLWAESFGAKNVADNFSGLYIDDNDNIYLYFKYSGGFDFFNHSLTTGAASEYLVALIAKDGKLLRDFSTVGASSLSITSIFDILVANSKMYIAGQFNFKSTFGSTTLTTASGNDGFLQEIDPPAGIESHTFEGISASFYPNPGVNFENFSYSIKNNSMVSFTITDMNGKMLVEKSLGEQPKGSNNYQFDVSSLKQGLYIFTLDIDGNILHQKFIKE